MIWLSWRQFRAQLLVAAGAVLAAAVVLAVTGPRLADLTGNVYDQLTRADHWLWQAGVVVVAVAPALLGAFWGAPLVARELEAGTYRLVWNQSVTRTRWLATRLGLTALGAAAAVGVLTLAVTWWAAPLDGAQSDTRGGLPARLAPAMFGMRGLVPVAYAVFALTLGVLVGLVLRRPLAAMAVTLALYVAAQTLVPVFVRPHLAPPVRETAAVSGRTMDGIQERNGVMLLTTRVPSPGAWVLTNRTLGPDGRPIAALPEWFGACVPGPGTGSADPAEARATLDGCLTRLATEGYQQQLVYQPASRFWRLQWTEAGLYLGVSALLAGASFWWLRRRLT